MKNYVLIILGILGCNRQGTDKAQTREMYDAGVEHVISTFVNSKLQTMSVLYGNEAAKECAIAGYTTHHHGEVFTLVMYKQANNKYWYGSYINWTLKSVETVSFLATDGKTDRLTYKLRQGRAPTDSSGRP